jgi:hypothetical protein
LKFIPMCATCWIDGRIRKALKSTRDPSLCGKCKKEWGDDPYLKEVTLRVYEKWNFSVYPSRDGKKLRANFRGYKIVNVPPHRKYTRRTP